jgi:hypothetical protein
LFGWPETCSYLHKVACSGSDDMEIAGVIKMKSKQLRVTLIELEAVIVIVGVLAATAFPRISAFHAVLFGS